MSDSIEIVLNVGQAQSYVQKKRGVLIGMLTERVDLVDSMMADRVKANLGGAVLQTRSGKLLGTVKQTPASVSGSQIYGAVTAGGADAPYGVYFEEGGSSYYEIRPINAQVLAFMSQGKQVFAKVVNHPPTPKLPWFAPEKATATEEMKTQLHEVFVEALK